MTIPAVAMFLAGVGLFVYGFNGYRLARVGFGSFNAEMSSPAISARKIEDAQTKQVEVRGEASDSPEATEAPVAQVPVEGEGEFDVFKLEDIPLSVVKDALARWPDSERPPDNLGEFEFAMRKRGKGNHPWTLKFRGRKALSVWYGSRGGIPTVKQKLPEV